MTMMDIGMVNPGTTSVTRLKTTKNAVKKVIKDTDLNKFTTSVKPVCRITLLKEPISKKLTPDTNKRKGS